MEFANPFINSLKDCKNILLCGCGGGFDFMQSIPLYTFLRKQKKNVVLGNLSFVTTDGTGMSKSKKISSACWEVTKNSSCSLHHSYFPEKYCCQFIEKEFGDDKMSIYIWPRWVRVDQLLEAYELLCEIHNIDCIVLVDGGSDSLQRGDEETLADVEEDATSVAACSMVKNKNVKKKFVTFIGLGVDKYNGVWTSLLLQNMAGLISSGGYLGCFSLLKEMEEYQMYRKALEFVEKKCKFQSVVSHSVRDSIDGKFGNFHSTDRTKNSGSTLFINPLMSIYFCFDACKVAERNFFIQEYLNAKSEKNKEKSHSIGVHLTTFRREAAKKNEIRRNKPFPH